MFVYCPWETYGNTSDWMAYIGNYMGGIVGGICGALIALAIVKHEIDLVKRNEEENRLIKQISTLAGVLYQLEQIQNNLERARKVKRKYISDNMPLRGSQLFLPLNDKYWTGLSNISDMALLVDLIKIQEFYSNFQRSAAKNDIKLKLDILETQIPIIEEPISANGLNRRILIYQLENEYKLAIKEKDFYWEKVDENIDLVERLIKEIMLLALKIGKLRLDRMNGILNQELNSEIEQEIDQIIINQKNKIINS